MVFSLEKYQLESGKIPFDDWLHKGSQRKDIAIAKKLWNEYLKRKGE